VQELFDFARASALPPGQTITLYFTLPPLVAATVDRNGAQALTPGRFVVRIGDVPSNMSGITTQAGAVEGTIEIVGRAPVVISPGALQAMVQ
jgi:hypothetical protein